MRKAGYYWAKIEGDSDWIIVEYYPVWNGFCRVGSDEPLEESSFSIIEETHITHD